MSSAVPPELQVAALSGEVDAVMRGIVDRLMELPEVDGASLSTIDGELTHFRMCTGTDEELQGQIIPLEQTLGAICIANGDLTVLRQSSGGNEVDRCLTPGAASILLAPLEWDGAWRGILGVRSASLDAFDDASVEQARMLAAGAGIALRNAELVERLAASERNYRDLHAQAADAILVSDASGTILDANEAAAALLWRPIDELRALHARELFPEDELAANPPLTDELQLHGELRSERPFRRKDGAVLMLEYSSRVLEDGRVHTALRDVTQRKRKEERLLTSVGRLHAIVQTQQEISALELDQEAVTNALVERAQRLAGAEGAAVQWFDGDFSVLRNCSGIAAPHVGLRIDRFASLAGQAARTGEPVYSPDTTVDPRVDRVATARLGARSLLCAPLHRDGEVAGVLALMSSEPNAFDELAIETTRLMAEFVSTVIRNAADLDMRRSLVDELRTQGQVVEHMRTALWVWSTEGDRLTLEYANAASELATGLPAGDILGKTFDEVLPAVSPELVQRLRRVAKTGELYDLGEIEYGDARVPPSIFAVRAFPLAGERLAVTFENVTEVARSRRALQESEARFRGAFDAASVGMALTALDGTFVQVNRSLAEMLGYSIPELMRLGVRGISHPDDFEVDVDYVTEMRAGEVADYQREKRYVRKDGVVLWAHLTVSLVRGYDNAPTHVVSHVQDITAQKEAALLFESTFERSVVPILVMDDDRVLVDLNHAAARLLAVDHDRALTFKIDDLLPDNPVAELWESFLDSGTMEDETWAQLPDGSRRRIEFVATANVRPGRHIAVVRDLTKQKELEAQLRQAQKMEAVGRLAGGIAHDFNNLLTAIAGYSEFLIGGLGDEKLRRHAQEINKASARAAALTGQLLAFSRRQVLQPRVLDLNAVVSDMDMMLRRLIGEDVELVTTLEPELSPVRADPTQVEQVIVNLAVNARDAMPHGGSVTIETANVTIDDDSHVELRLTDTGVGMTEEERHQLFDPFFTTKEGGTGLGLATVYGIVDQSGGTIEVDSAPGLGSSFRILLPAAEGAVEVRPSSAASEADAPGQGHETILFVEDEAIVRQLVAEILESNGYAVLQAADGPSALELLRRHSDPIELLVTDVVMPGMSGPEVAKAVTSMRPGTHVLYISGYTDQAIGHHGVLEPGIAFLQKPFSAGELARKVRDVLDGSTVGID
jgi:two-component system cell cycle sensor histidine kinase/response regulator CckA